MGSSNTKEEKKPVARSISTTSSAASSSNFKRTKSLPLSFVSCFSDKNNNSSIGDKKKKKKKKNSKKSLYDEFQENQNQPRPASSKLKVKTTLFDVDYILTHTKLGQGLSNKNGGGVYLCVRRSDESKYAVKVYI